MKRYDLITPEGTRDLLFEECAAVRAVEERLQGIFKSKGYSEVITPGLEFYDVFDQKSRYFPQETMYKLCDNKGRLMVVRPDSTMPIARMAATRLQGQQLPIRLCYSQSIYRNKPVMRGRSDEFRQTGIELIGSGSARAELEILSNALEVLGSFETGGYRLELGHIGFFKSLVAKLGCGADKIESIRSLIEVKNYPALNDLLDDMGNNEVTRALKQLPRLFGGEEIFEAAAALDPGEDGMAALGELRGTYARLISMGYEGKITVDLGLVNRMDYYTGTVIKGYIEGCGDAVLSGGRYDGLLGEFGMELPAAGFAVNIDAVARTEMKTRSFRPGAADVIVFGEDGFEAAAAVYCKELISKGYKAEYAVCDSVDEAKKYAAAKGIVRLDIFSGNGVEELTVSC
ncbi:MAG: ATP phosphoribosyltransferase regulatory subunit [Oscillospiraceae bacterium]|nr:ATP phosphoribosyltransferase regulatory subunit [Oscillospiraceae bacterium]